MARIFLSYASEDRTLARDIQARLRQHGHDVFFDEERLKPSDAYDAIIRSRIRRSDAMVFLCSPASLADGRYTLTELSIAQRLWPAPQGRILPVLIGDTGFDELPSYLKGLSAFRPQGDPVADIVDQVEEMAARRSRRKRLWWIAGIAAVALAAFLGALAGGFIGGERGAAGGDTDTEAAAEEAAGPQMNEDLRLVTITDAEVDNFNDYETVMERPMGLRICANTNFNVLNSSSRRIMLRVAVAYSDVHQDMGALEPDGFVEVEAHEEIGLFLVDARTDNVLHYVEIGGEGC